ncbi:hypothetical protein GUJ93_ZPchr0004g40159 [Zizania palustris]|uniref:Glycosyltransferase n=1 Tax=Zizania palustris TaxID=103762 RepID=A0A8J5VYZ5_ZIZPA|nr:hypothetical protein GUJ93_ZPchr0004g40159 [Zizania palustris]
MTTLGLILPCAISFTDFIVQVDFSRTKVTSVGSYHSPERCTAPPQTLQSPSSRPPATSQAYGVRASSADDNSFIIFHELPFVPADYGLPAGCESSDAIPASRIIDLLEAYEMLQPAFDEFVAGVTATAGSVVCVVSDPFMAWTVTVARRHGCTHSFFASCGAFGSAVVHSLWGHLPVRPDEASRVHLPEYPEVVIDRSQVSSNSLRPATAGKDRGAAFYGRQIPLGYKTDAVLINTVEKFEPTGLAMLRRTLKLPVLPIGPLLRASSGPTSPETPADAASIISFLDSHPPSSVLYISFGSQNSILAEHMTELAAALETTGGTVYLGRQAAGSHCGWNSVLESITHSVPIIGWPLSGEQFYNAKMLDEEWGVCVEVARGNMEGAVVKGKLVSVMQSVMGQTAKAAEMRRRVAEIKEIMEAAWAEGGDESPAMKTLDEFFTAMKLK